MVNAAGGPRLDETNPDASDDGALSWLDMAYQGSRLGTLHVDDLAKLHQLEEYKRAPLDQLGRKLNN